MKRRHEQIMKRDNVSSLVAFNNLISTKKIKTRADVNYWFNELVDKSDYTRGLRDDVLEYAYSLIN